MEERPAKFIAFIHSSIRIPSVRRLVSAVPVEQLLLPSSYRYSAGLSGRIPINMIEYEARSHMVTGIASPRNLFSRYDVLKPNAACAPDVHLASRGVNKNVCYKYLLRFRRLRCRRRSLAVALSGCSATAAADHRGNHLFEE